MQGRLEDQVTEKVDVYSFGVCLWEIWMLGEHVHPDLSLPDIFNGAIQGTLCPELPASCPLAWSAAHFHLTSSSLTQTIFGNLAQVKVWRTQD